MPVPSMQGLPPRTPDFRVMPGVIFSFIISISANLSEYRLSLTALFRYPDACS